MSQGLFTAASGISTNQAKIDVISDNIANINTVGFKSSQINFKTVFARTLSAGSAPTDSLGGVNPQQIGLGVMIGEIGRNFTNGSIQTTGRTTDLNIQGEGFFVVKKGTETNNDAEYFLTRAGNFSADADGFLVNSDGYKVVGTDQQTPVQVPVDLNFENPDAASTSVVVENVGQATGSTVTEGTFTMNISDGATNSDVTVTISSTDTLAQIATKMQTALQGSAEDADGDVTVAVGGPNNNQLIITTPDAETVTFAGADTDTSNFLSIMGFTAGAVGDYDSAELVDQSQLTISDITDAGIDANNNATATTFSINNDGSLEVTYSNGGKLTVANGDLKYVSATGREILGVGPGAITDNADDIAPAQMQLQLANVVNPQGLLAEGGNLFSQTSVAGDVTYGTAGSSGMGVINSGSLEASNVDLSREFSNMILAQRGVEACSRTFSVQDRILQTIVNLGR